MTGPSPTGNQVYGVGVGDPVFNLGISDVSRKAFKVNPNATVVDYQVWLNGTSFNLGLVPVKIKKGTKGSYVDGARALAGPAVAEVAPNPLATFTEEVVETLGGKCKVKAHTNKSTGVGVPRGPRPGRDRGRAREGGPGDVRPHPRPARRALERRGVAGLPRRGGPAGRRGIIPSDVLDPLAQKGRGPGSGLVSPRARRRDLAEVLGFIVERRNYLLAPIILLLLAAAIFVVVFEIPALAPFIYALF